MNHRDKIYMKMALEVAKASKCQKAKYGVVVVSSDDRVVTTAYNGKPRGSCNDHECYRKNSDAMPCCIHAEANAMLFASRHDLRDATLYVSGLPCATCMLLVANSGVKRVVALRDGYDYKGIDHIGLYGLPIRTRIMNYEELS